MDLDMEQRDPNDVNNHLKASWDEVIAEPVGANSHPCVWKCSYTCFTCSKTCMYYLLTFVWAWYLAFWWGVVYAITSFYHIWILTPNYLLCKINCGFCRKYWSTCLECCVGPCCETIGLIFSRITVENRSA